MKRKTRSTIKKLQSFVLMIGLLAGLTSCEMWYKDWKGYLEYWSSTVQIGKIEVSNITIQKDINNKSTISMEEPLLKQEVSLAVTLMSLEPMERAIKFILLHKSNLTDLIYGGTIKESSLRRLTSFAHYS